jgi:hypothetical protein
VTELNMTPASKIRRIAKASLALVLTPQGFRPRSDRKWTRVTEDLRHDIVLASVYGKLQVEWGIVCPELTAAVWHEERAPDSTSSWIVYGTASNVKWPLTCPNPDPNVGTVEELEEIANGLAEDVRSVEEVLRPLRTRHDLRELLLSAAERDKPPHMVRNGPLTLFMAAYLAIVDGDADMDQLVSKAKEALITRSDAHSRARYELLENQSQ